jgi:hypothetical protein
MVMILFNLIVTNIYVNIQINDRPTKIREHPGGSIDISGGKYEFLSNLFRVSSLLSFVSIWLTTSLLMYSSKDAILGKIQYWIILIIPLAYFIVSYFAQTILAGVIFPLLSTNPVSTALVLISVFTLSKPIGGFVFGISFWRISKLVNFQKTLQEYVTISGYGFLLIFSANQSSSLVLVPFPPFGITTVTVLIIAAYFIYIGIYKSATMISINSGIRKSIYETARESKLLNLSGRTEMEKETTNTVNKVIKNTRALDKLTDENTEIDETELKNYVKKVLHELKKDRSR